MRGNADYLSGIRQRLYTAVLSDVLDELGFRHQAMPPSIRPLDDALVMAGYARTGSYREVYRVVPDEILRAGDGADRRSPVGRHRGLRLRRLVADRAVGRAADDRLARTRRGRRRHGWIRQGHQADPDPALSGVPWRHSPLDSKGRGMVAEIDVPIQCAGVAAAPGDLIVGDADGVVVVPRAVEAQAVARAFEKVSSEDRTREELAAGARLRDVFAKYRVL